MSAAAPRCSEVKATLREMGVHRSADQKCTVIIPSDGQPCGALYAAHPETAAAAAPSTSSSSAGQSLARSAERLVVDCSSFFADQMCVCVCVCVCVATCGLCRWCRRSVSPCVMACFCSFTHQLSPLSLSLSLSLF
jgi:hypothetical protein